MRTEKTKAHRSLEEAKSLEGVELAIWRGNWEADVAAKAAARRHPQPTDEDANFVKERLAQLPIIAHWVAEVLTRWPKVPRDEVNSALRKPRAQRPARGENTSEHLWARHCGRWQCRRCFKFTSTTEGKRRQDAQKCAGGKSIATTILAAQAGHAIVVGQIEGGVFFFCAVCGAWATARPQDLVKRCRGQPSAYGRRSRNSIARGFLPDSEVPVVGGHWPLTRKAGEAISDFTEIAAAAAAAAAATAAPFAEERVAAQVAAAEEESAPTETTPAAASRAELLERVRRKQQK